MPENTNECLNFKTANFADKLLLYVRTLFENKQNCDSLIFGENDGKIRAHRLIIDSVIPGLIPLSNSQKRTCKMNKNDKNALFVYRMPLMIETITKVLKFCYTGEMSIANDELAPLLKFAIDYNVKELIDVCSNSLKQSIDPDSFKQIVKHWKNADNELELRMWRQIICRNFLKVSKYPTFGEITMDQFVNILRSPDLKGVREEEVFNAFLLWLEKPNNVSAHLDIGSMLTHIRFPLMNLKFFTEKVEKLLEQFNRNDLIFEYYKWNLTQSKLIGTTTKFSNERMSLRENDLVVLSHKINNKLLMQIIPPQFGKPIISREIAELQYNKYQSVTFVYDGKLIISGGKDNQNNNLSTVTGFNLETFEIMEYPALQTPRSSHASIVSNGDIYVAGGYSDVSILNSVEKYSQIDKKWVFVKSMIQNRLDFYLVAVNGYIYALGGREFIVKPMLNSVERYDPSLDVWTSMAPMAYPRTCFSAVAHNNSIYVFGGAQKMRKEEKGLFSSDITDKVEKYNVITNSWSTIYTMDTARTDIISCLYGDYIILLGGSDEKKKEIVKAIQVFDRDRLECVYMNSLKEDIFCSVAFSAPTDLVEKLKKHPVRTNIKP